MYYLGVDIGGSAIKAGLVDETGAISQQAKVPTPATDLKALTTALVELVRGYQASAAIQAVGIGIPGFKNSATQQVISSPNIPCLTNVSIERIVADEVHLPVVSANDANAAAWGEFTCGAGVGLRHMACLTLGTGLGSGVILNGELFSGKSGFAVELGHIVIQPHTRPCGCGSLGCVETFVSAGGLILTARELLERTPASTLYPERDRMTPESIHAAAIGGDSVAIEALRQTGSYLGLTCTNLINALNLELIVLAGGMLAAGDFLLKPALDEVQRHALKPSLADCRIVQSKLWPDAGVVGAAMVAKHSIHA